MDVFSAAPHHNVLVLIVQVGVLLLAARAFGEIAQRLGQPSVVGELLAGIILGLILTCRLFSSSWRMVGAAKSCSRLSVGSGKHDRSDVFNADCPVVVFNTY